MAATPCVRSLLNSFGRGARSLALPLRAVTTAARHHQVASVGAVRSMAMWSLQRSGSRLPSSATAHHARRTMFIQTKDTPNPNSMMFLVNAKLLDSGTVEFSSGTNAHRSPLARSLFRVEGVKTVFFGTDFITIVKADDVDWAILKPSIFGSIMDFFATNQPVFLENTDAPADTVIKEQDSEVVATIKELLDTRIRPAVQEDGGDILYHDFRDGIVYLALRGSCTSCPSSIVTLKNGVENMLMHYVPEVMGVEQHVDEMEKASRDQLAKVEKSIEKE